MKFLRQSTIFMQSFSYVLSCHLAMSCQMRIMSVAASIAPPPPKSYIYAIMRHNSFFMMQM